MAKVFSIIFFLISIAIVSISLPRLPGINGILIAAVGIGALVGSWGFWRISKKNEKKKEDD